MKYQTKNKATSRTSSAARALVGTGALLLMAAMLVGCSVTNSRVITATHWGAPQNEAAGAKRVQQPDVAPAADEAQASAEGAQDADAVAAADAKALADAQAKIAGVQNAQSASSADGTDLTLYVGYVETITAETLLSSDDDSPLAVQSFVRFCNLKPDASLECTESAELNKMLNPHMH